MISRVGRVAVKLRLAEADREHAAAMRKALEQVVIRSALEELERVIHARYGATAVVRIRKLSARWRLDHDMLADPAIALELGRDLAAGLVADIDALPRPDRLRPSPAANVVVFQDADHAVAAFLADAADGVTAWFHAPRGDAAVEWEDARTCTPPRLPAIASWLERMERREDVERLVDMPPRPVTRPPDAAAAIQLPVIAAGARLQPGSQHAHPPMAPQARDPVRLPVAEQHRDAHAPDVTAGLGATLEEAPVIELDAPGWVDTRAAGLWYLARLVMQLDLAQQLWAVGLVEGDFLAHVACAIGGIEIVNDPGWRWFGGAFDREPLLENLPPWAVTELAEKRAELGNAVVADLPCVTPGDPATQDTVSRSAAALCALFCARLGVEPDVATVRRYTLLPGRLELGETLHVRIPMALVDVDVRRAGLDLDPGHLPWLGRKVEIIFEGDSY